MIVLNGIERPTEFEVENFLTNKALKLGERSCRGRKDEERAKICAIIFHTTKGIPGGKDLRPMVLKKGQGPNTKAGARTVSMWANDTTRYAGAHFIVDFDGSIYQCADVVLTATYHAELANGRTVGIELCQGKDAEVYEAQMESGVNLANWLTEKLSIQRQIPNKYQGPIERLEGKLNTYGVFGHRDLTNRRGAGDPGDFIFQALKKAGFESWDFKAGEDITVWRDRQRDLGVPPDGQPGPKTVEALVDKGHPHGLWVE
jgi:hypothetical protein